jgi:WD40 repeat protein
VLQIKNLALSPTEETLLCSLADNQVYSLALNNSEIMKADEMNFTHMAQDFHIEGVTGVDVSVRKPLVATCSSDHTVRLWNYLDKSAELVRSFTEEAFSVAIHPHGLSLLVGHADKLRLLTILLDDMRVIKEFPIKSCRECRFSHGGAMFAAVNSNTIQVRPALIHSPFLAVLEHGTPLGCERAELVWFLACLDIQHLHVRERR